LTEEIAAVFGFGCRLDKEGQLLLNQVAEGIMNGGIKAVIGTGGYTSRKSLRGVSEAEVIYSYLYARLIGEGYKLVPRCWQGFGYDFLERKPESIKQSNSLKEIDFYFEDCARTTRENILFIKALLEKYGVWEKCRLVVYCDKARWIKISVLAFLVWNYRPSAVKSNPRNGFRDYIEQIVYVLPTVFALKIKFLRDLEDARRERQMDES
jgi:hypothetical protein